MWLSEVFCLTITPSEITLNCKDKSCHYPLTHIPDTDQMVVLIWGEVVEQICESEAFSVLALILIIESYQIIWCPGKLLKIKHNFWIGQQIFWKVYVKFFGIFTVLQWDKHLFTLNFEIILFLKKVGEEKSHFGQVLRTYQNFSACQLNFVCSYQKVTKIVEICIKT